MKNYATVISDYSLAAGKVGKPIGEPEIIEHSDGYEALRVLWVAITTPYPKDQGRKFLIRTPDGRELSFDSAYEEIVREPPVYRDNKATKYPRHNKTNRNQ
jgi:hypothetical protein